MKKSLSKQDFLRFLDNLISDDTLDVFGVKAKGKRFVFAPLESSSELRLDYDVTILPPKKFFEPLKVGSSKKVLRNYLTGKEISEGEVLEMLRNYYSERGWGRDGCP